MVQGKGYMNNKYLIFKVGNGKYALHTDNVLSMDYARDVTEIVGYSKSVKGTMDMRGHQIPLVDLRVVAGFDSYLDEKTSLIENLKVREQEHVDWMRQLEVSLNEGITFNLARDHTLCNFGKWYYNFKTQDRLLVNHLKRIEEPHKNIHALADKVLDLKDRGDVNGALRMYEKAKVTDYATILNLFSGLYELILEADPEMAVLVDYNNEVGPFAIAVDRIETVKDIIEVFDGSTGSEFVTSFANFDNDENKLVGIIDKEVLVRGLRQ